MTHPLLRGAGTPRGFNLVPSLDNPARVIARLAAEIKRLQRDNLDLRLTLATQDGLPDPGLCATYSFDGVEDFLVCTDDDGQPCAALFLPTGSEDRLWF